MIKKTLYFGNPVYLSLRNAQLVIKLPEVVKNDTLPDGFKQQSEVTKPIEDLGVVVLDNKQITITSGVLEALLENNCAIITCDSKSMPVGLMLPLYGNTTQNERFRQQLDASLPLIKQLWQQTVRMKIENQAAVLKKCAGEEVKCMTIWAADVKSGDSDNLEARAARLKNLYVFLNTEATVEKVKQFKPDIVVNATGSVPLVPPIKGLKENIEAGNVATIFDMINNLNAGKYPDEACQGKKVVVVGGGSVGLDVIEYFAPRGAECTIIDMLPQIGMLADPITKCSMRETHDKYGVKEYVNTALQEVKENAFTVKLPDGQIKDMEFDLGFNCLGMRSNNPVLPGLEEAFKDTETYVYTVRARRIMEGTMEGRAILNVLESQGYLHLEPLE